MALTPLPKRWEANSLGHMKPGRLVALVALPLVSVTQLASSAEARHHPTRASAPAVYQHGMVSAADPRAADAGAEMLRAGGSATDAALATLLALNVVEPQSSGIGGGAFLTYYDAKTRMGFIERFTPAFPNSRFEDQVTSYALVSLSELKDMARLVAYGEKALAANPNSLATLLLLANTYVEDPKPGSLSKAITYSQKAIEVAKADAPDADRSRKVSAGVAHYTLGYAYLKQEKATAAVPELKAASALLKGQDDQQYALTLYRLGFAYGKLNRVTEAREVLTEAVKIPGPAQQPSRDLLATVNAARAKGK